MVEILETLRSYKRSFVKFSNNISFLLRNILLRNNNILLVELREKIFFYLNYTFYVQNYKVKFLDNRELREKFSENFSKFVFEV